MSINNYRNCRILYIKNYIYILGLNLNLGLSKIKLGPPPQSCLDNITNQSKKPHTSPNKHRSFAQSI